MVLLAYLELLLAELRVNSFSNTANLASDVEGYEAAFAELKAQGEFESDVESDAEFLAEWEKMPAETMRKNLASEKFAARINRILSRGRS